MDPLATPDDIAARLARTLESSERARAAALLADASALFRAAAAGQFISAGSTTDLRCTVKRGDPDVRDIEWFERDPAFRFVTLPQRPIVEISAVTDTDGAPIDFELLVDDRVRVTGGPFVLVSYTHGFDPIPDDIIAAVCSAVLEQMSVEPSAVGLSGETIGNYSYQRQGIPGGLALPEPARLLAQAYGRPVGTARML